jgi:lysophospholipase L1-like esterase
MISPYMSAQAGLSTSSADSRYTPNIADSGQLLKFQTALAKVASNISDCNVIFMGDSITSGFVTSDLLQPPTDSFVAKMVDMYADRTGYTVAHGLQNACLQANATNVVETRWNVTGGDWVINAYGWGGVGSGGSTMLSAASGAGTKVIFTPGYTGDAWDTADVRVYAGGGFGTIVVTATGGAPITYDCGSGSGFHTVTVSAAATLDTNAIECHHSAGGPVYVIDITTRKTATKQVLFGNAGRPSSTSGDWNQAGALGSLALIANTAPDLSIIALGTNDARTGVAVSTFVTNMGAIITAAQASGDVILKTLYPTSDATALANTPAYNAAIRQLGQTYNCPVFDQFTAAGSAWYSPMYSDSLHPNDYGHHAIASFMSRTLADCS